MLLIQNQLRRFCIVFLGVFILCNIAACSEDSVPCSHKNSLKPCEQENEPVELVILEQIEEQYLA